MSNKASVISSSIISGTIMLSVSGVLSRLLGFLYRIFLSNLIGAHGLGIFQLIFPVLTFFTSFCCGGIQTAVSRFVAESKSLKKSISILFASLILSESLSILAMFIMNYFARFIAVTFLGNQSCTVLIKYAAYIIPFTSFHSCVTGFYLGLKRPAFPSIIQITEQITKIIALFIVSEIMVNSFSLDIGSLATFNGDKLSPLLAIISLVISEIFGFIFCIFAIVTTGSKDFSFDILSGMGENIKKIFNVSYILTINKIVLTFLQSAEALLLPYALCKYGMTSKESLVLYGTLVGIALPVVTFPASICTSASMMILPEVADANISGNTNKIKRTSEFTTWFSIVTGLFFIGIFIFYGNFIGSEIFGEVSAGKYIKIFAWICPFIYMSISFGSILHGLGKTTAAFIHNSISVVIRLGCLLLFVPRFGIKAWFFGMLISQMLTMFLHYYYINKSVPLNFCVKTNIIKPVIWLTISLTTGYLCSYVLSGFINVHSLVIHYIIKLISAFTIFLLYFYFAYKQWKLFKA